MQLADYHTHSHFSDGAESPEAMLRHAIDLGLTAYGVADHAPILKYGKKWNMSYDKQQEYTATLQELKQKYQANIKVYCSLEIDYIPDVVNPKSDYLPHQLMDYTVGSIHYLGRLKNGNLEGFELLGKELQFGLHQYYKGNAMKLVEDYYQNIRDMITYFTPTIIGHLDRIRLINREQIYFKESDHWYQDEIKETLKVLANTSSIMEINTKSVYSGVNQEPYPSYAVIQQANKLNIPMLLSSDAHQSQYITASFSDIYDKLNDYEIQNWAKIP